MAGILYFPIPDFFFIYLNFNLLGLVIRSMIKHWNIGYKYDMLQNTMSFVRAIIPLRLFC